MKTFYRRSKNGRSVLNVPAAAALILGALSVAGCQSTSTTEADLIASDYTKRHPITLSEEPESLVLPIGMKATQLSPEISAAIRQHVIEYRASGTGAMTIQVPSGSANEGAAVSAARAAARVMVSSGVPKNLIRMVPYPISNPTKVAPVRLTFLRVKAVTPECGLWPVDIAANRSNTSAFNVGCAQQQNLAAMVANPADFVTPRLETPANGARRAKVLSDYADGNDTQSGMKLIGSDLGD